MKEIQGKIKFLVIENPDNVTWTGYFDPKDNTFHEREKGWVNPDTIGRLSELTEEQCAELVDSCEDGFGNYENAQLKWFDTAKESLVSLLKANDCWIKEWCNEESFVHNYQMASKGMGALAALTIKGNAPDDFLIIKL